MKLKEIITRDKYADISVEDNVSNNIDIIISVLKRRIK